MQSRCSRAPALLQVIALQVQLAAYLFELADGGSPFAKGSPLARAAEDADAYVRAAAVCLAPAFVACVSRHSKALQAAVLLLQKLAGESLQALAYQRLECRFYPA